MTRWSGSSRSPAPPGARRGPRRGRPRDLTGALARPPAEHRRHREVARRQPQLRQLGEHLHAGRVEAGLLLGLAQRRLHGVSPGSMRAAGERHLAGVGAHVVGTLGEQQVGAVAPSPKSIRTAPRRGSESSGGRNRVRSWTVIDRAPSSTGSSHSGSPAGPHSVDPEVPSTSVERPVDGLDPPGALLVRPGRRRRRTADSGSRRSGRRAAPLPRSRPAGRRAAGRSRRSRDQRERAAGWTSSKSTPRTAHPVAVPLVEALEHRHLRRGTARTRRPRC